MENQIIRSLHFLIETGLALPEKDFLLLWDSPNGLKRLICEEGVDPEATIPEQQKPRYEQVLANAVSNQLEAIRSPISRQRKWEQYVRAFTYMNQKHGFFEDQDVKEIVPQPVVGDKGALFVKALHPKEGVTKEELSSVLGISDRQVRGYLALLGGSAPEKQKQLKDLRFAGQILRAKIESNVGEHGKQRYSTPDTVHPVALQMNVMEVGTLLRSLSGMYSNEDSAVSRSLAIEVWAQLSSYAKNRLHEVFGAEDPSFDSFLSELEQEVCSSVIPVFHTEPELEQANDFSIKELVFFALKNERLCDISLKTDGIILHNRKIRPGSDSQHYSAIPFTSNKVSTNSGIEFLIEEVRNITLK